MLGGPHLTIHQVWGRLGIRTDWAELRLECVPHVFNLDIDPPRAELSIRDPRIEIDYTRAEAARGLYRWDEFTRRMVAHGAENALEAIGRIAAEGDEMMRIEENGPEVIVEQAVEKSWTSYRFEFHENSFAGADVTVLPGEVRVDLRTGRVAVIFRPGEVRNYTPRGGVEIWVAQKPQLEIVV